MNIIITFIGLMMVGKATGGFSLTRLETGVYQEDNEEVEILSSKWNFMIKMDLKEMDEKLKQLKDYRNDIIQFCLYYRSEYCNNFINLSEKMIQKIIIQKENIMIMLKQRRKEPSLILEET